MGVFDKPGIRDNIVTGVAPGATGIKVRSNSDRGYDIEGNQVHAIEGIGIDVGRHDHTALDQFVRDVAPHMHLMTTEQAAEFPKAIEALRQFPESNRAGVATFLKGIAGKSAGSALATIITGFLVR